MKDKMIYLDYAAATPLDARVREAMEPYLREEYGNPSSIHGLGRRAKKAIENARKTIARILHCRPEEIVFTSGGTEAVNLAMQGSTQQAKPANISLLKNGHIIASKIEHHAVLRTVQMLEKEGFSAGGGPASGWEITYLDVDKYGVVSPEAVKRALHPETILVSVMYANNEIGTIEPIAEIGKMIRTYRSDRSNRSYPLFFTDACQAAGYLDLNVERLGVDLMALNASKIYGPKGVGCLFVRRGVLLHPLLYGGGQERRLRSGTENVAGIVGFARALEIAQAERVKENARITELRGYFIKEVLRRIPDAELNGHPTERLPNNINISIPGIEGETVVIYLDEKGIAASTGAACSSVEIEPSHVISALGKSREYAQGSLRFTLGRDTAKEDLDYVLEVLLQVVKTLRPVKYGVPQKKKSGERVPTV